MEPKPSLEALLHSGIKGMKWGVRNDTPIKSKGKIRQHLDSLKRERAWGVLIKEMHNMSTSDMKIVKKRIDLENSLKSLSKTRIATAKDKQDYLRRSEMDDHELSRKVTRLQSKANLYKSVMEASKTQREFGQKVVQVGGSLAMKYAVNKKLGPDDFFKAAMNPKEAGKEAKKTAMDLATGKIKSPKLKKAVDRGKQTYEVVKANKATNDKAKS